MTEPKNLEELAACKAGMPDEGQPMPQAPWDTSMNAQQMTDKYPYAEIQQLMSEEKSKEWFWLSQEYPPVFPGNIAPRDFWELAYQAFRARLLAEMGPTAAPSCVPFRQLKEGECFICGGFHGGLQCPQLTPTSRERDGGEE